MLLPFSIETSRLLITPLTITDSVFILELVNTAGWLTFIGDRNVHTTTEAAAYIQKILDNKNIVYWVVKQKDVGEKMGVISYIKRDYLAHPDIGFAFLPRFGKKGFAFEAANAVLQQLMVAAGLKHILATTIPENKSSISLLKKLGLCFEKELEIDKQLLHIYGADMEALSYYLERTT